MSAKSSTISSGVQFFAEFDFDGSPPCLVRKDTRVYYHSQNPTSMVRGDGVCKGVIWMCNPGSAGNPGAPRPWGSLQPDPTLRAVLHMFQQAAALKGPVFEAGMDDYILVMNCYYSVDQDYVAAYRRWIASSCCYRERIPKKSRFIVAAWGAGKPHGPVWRAIQRIRQQRKKVGSALLVVYIDAPLSRGGVASISNRLAAMKYPAHPLNPQFAANSPNLAVALAPCL